MDCPLAEKSAATAAPAVTAATFDGLHGAGEKI